MGTLTLSHSLHTSGEDLDCWGKGEGQWLLWAACESVVLRVTDTLDDKGCLLRVEMSRVYAEMVCAVSLAFAFL